MKQVHYYGLLLMSFSLILLAVGCQPKVVSPEEALSQSLNQIQKEAPLQYTGYTSSEVNGVDMERMVEFQGVVKDPQHVYMEITFQPQTEFPESHVLYGGAKDLLVKRDNQWQPVQQTEEYLKQQFMHWDPVTNIDEILGMDKTVSFPARAAASDPNHLVVEITPADMKGVITKDLKEQFEASLAERPDVEQLRESLKLSDEEYAEMKQQLEDSVARSRADLDQLISTLQVNAKYTLVSDTETLQPLKLTMDVASSYETAEGPVDERTQVIYEFKNYGQEAPVELPAS